MEPRLHISTLFTWVTGIFQGGLCWKLFSCWILTFYLVWPSPHPASEFPAIAPLRKPLKKNYRVFKVLDFIEQHSSCQVGILAFRWHHVRHDSHLFLRCCSPRATMTPSVNGRKKQVARTSGLALPRPLYAYQPARVRDGPQECCFPFPWILQPCKVLQFSTAMAQRGKLHLRPHLFTLYAEFCCL